MRLGDVLDEIYDRIYQYEERVFDKTIEYFEQLRKANGLGAQWTEDDEPTEAQITASIRYLEKVRTEFDEAWRNYREAIEELCAFTTDFLCKFKPLVR